MEINLKNQIIKFIKNKCFLKYINFKIVINENKLKAFIKQLNDI